VACHTHLSHIIYEHSALSPYFAKVNKWLIYTLWIGIIWCLPLGLSGQAADASLSDVVSKIRRVASSDQGDLGFLMQYFEAQDANPVKLAASYRQALQPIAKGSALEYHMAYFTMFAHDRANKTRDLQKVKPYMDTMLQLGLASNNIRLQAHATWAYAAHLQPYQLIDETATYYLLSIHLYEQLPFFERMYAKYGALSHILFHTGDYKACIEYGSKALKGKQWLTQQYDVSSAVMLLNTMGQAYYQMGLYDSALIYLAKSAAEAQLLQLPQWVAINAGFEGQVMLVKGAYGEALNNFEQCYVGNRGKDAPMECYSLLGKAKVYLQGGDDVYIQPLLWQALHIANYVPAIQRWQVAAYRREAYHTLSMLYLKQSRLDSFTHYSRVARALEDSMNRVLSTSNLRISETRVQVELLRMQGVLLLQEKDNLRTRRNFIILFLVAVALGGLIVLQRKNKLLRLKNEVAEAKKQAAEAEVAAAREQMDRFVKTLHEKTELIEVLKQQDSTSTSVPAALIQHLTTQTILTEADWITFRTNFEKLYPGYFTALRQVAPDITLAEQRMAALTLLQVNGKEIGSLLGISPDSIRKSKYRLRQRLQLAATDDLRLRLLDIYQNLHK